MENQPEKRKRMNTSISKIRVISSENVIKPKIKESSGRKQQFVITSENYMKLIAY